MENQQTMTRGRARAPRARRLVAAAAALAAAAVAVATLGLPGAAAAEQTDPITQVLEALFPTTTTTTTRPRPKTPMPAYKVTATPVGDVATYDAPNGRRIGTTGHWYGRQLTMPVVKNLGDWIQVRLPERPNGKTAWIQSRYVALGRTPYWLVIHRNAKSLTLYKDGYPQWTAPVGLGVAKTPTPLGSFFITVIEHDTTPGYGPLQLSTSAHSETIQSWQGMGDAITAIHGPISARSDRQIGTTGTYISNGCVRMHLADLQRLAVVPVGTPLDIVP
jgi:hypothetical protein